MYFYKDKLHLFILISIFNRFHSNESIMEKKFKKNSKLESRSGVGSSLAVTEIIRSQIPELLNELKIKSILDIPCGDFNWLKGVNLDIISYMGADIVSDIIKHNNEKYSAENKKFLKLDILKDQLPKVDLILCRDLLVHFSFKDINRALENIKKSGSVYLLTTSFVSKNENIDIKMGEWRPLNLEKPPFLFKPPLKIINENYQVEGEKFTDKSLCLWKISELL